MNKKNHNIVAIATALAITLSMPVFAQQQDPKDKKGNDKTASAHQASPQHQNAPQRQAVHQNAPQQQTVHQSAPQRHSAPQQQFVHQNAPQQQVSHQPAPQQQVTRAVNQSASIQNIPRHQATVQNGTPGRVTGYQHRNQRQNATQQTSNGLNQSTTPALVSQPVQSVQSGNGVRHTHNNQVQSYANQQGLNGSGNNIQQTSQPYAQNSGGYQGHQPQVAPNGQYNSGNNYGGYWSSGNTHNDWSHNGRHNWNNNDYVWYQGGWLIVNSFFNPYYVNSGYANNGYYNNGSLVSQVQTSLANLGYYNGPIDGDAGSGTRHAIASYQHDQNLNANGRINGDLLQSLQIQ